MIGLTIEPNQQVSDFNPYTVRDYMDMETHGCSLVAPERWGHKKLNLVLMTQKLVNTLTIHLKV